MINTTLNIIPKKGIRLIPKKSYPCLFNKSLDEVHSHIIKSLKAIYSQLFNKNENDLSWTKIIESTVNDEDPSFKLKSVHNNSLMFSFELDDLKNGYNCYNRNIEDSIWLLGKFKKLVINFDKQFNAFNIKLISNSKHPNSINNLNIILNPNLEVIKFSITLNENKKSGNLVYPTLLANKNVNNLSIKSFIFAISLLELKNPILLELFPEFCYNDISNIIDSDFPSHYDASFSDKLTLLDMAEY